jgi:transcriptional regulator with XRE-family HTH domain
MTRFTRPVHTFSSVIRELFEGLRDGSIAISSESALATAAQSEENRQPPERIPEEDLLNTAPISVDPRFLEETGLQEAGRRLRSLRERLGLTLQDVETSSGQIASKHGKKEYEISARRMTDIEMHSVLPSIYRLYSLAVIYRVDMQEILASFGLDLGAFLRDSSLTSPPKSHLMTMPDGIAAQNVPAIRDVVKHGGPLALFLLTQSAPDSQVSYALIGSEDFTMYPLLPPGSFIQVDGSRRQVVDRGWRSEYERPIYLVETNQGFTCCWCAFDEGNLVLQPHPLSPAPMRVRRSPEEAEVIGQVIGVAKPLTEWPVSAA